MGGYSPPSYNLTESVSAPLVAPTVTPVITGVQDSGVVNVSTAAVINIPTAVAVAGNAICITVCTTGVGAITVTSCTFGTTAATLIATADDTGVGGTDHWWSYWIQSVPAGQQNLTVNFSVAFPQASARLQEVNSSTGWSATPLFNSGVTSGTSGTYSSGSVSPPGGGDTFSFGAVFDAASTRINPPGGWISNAGNDGWLGFQFSIGSPVFAGTFVINSTSITGIACIVPFVPPPGLAVATVSITPGQIAQGNRGGGVGASRYSGLTWDVTGVAVSVSTNRAEAQASLYVSYGIKTTTQADFQGQTNTGSTGDTNSLALQLRPGDWITVVWTGGDAGSIATARILGTVNPPGLR